MSDRAFVDALVKIGVDPITESNPDKAAAMVKTELAKWGPIIQALGWALMHPLAQRRRADDGGIAS